MNSTQEDRRFDLDWLRVLAFGSLIFYHIGMFYVTWDWHIKSIHSSSAPEPWMILINPWRLSLLFLISGMALRFMIDNHIVKRMNLTRFAWNRTWKLFVPLMFAIHSIVAPQAWLQLTESGEVTSGYWDFFSEYLIGTKAKYSIEIPTWNHLWYVAYLIVYTLILIPIAKPLIKLMNVSGRTFINRVLSSKFAFVWLLLIPTIPHFIYRIFLDAQFPTTHDLINDWANHAHSFTYLLFGFVLARESSFHTIVQRNFKLLILGTALLAIILSAAWGNWESIESEILLWFFRYLRVLYIWIFIITVLSFAQNYLFKPSKVLTYLSESVFSSYILHQTIIIMVGYWLTRQGLSVGLEILTLTLITISGCFLLNELFIRRFKYVRPFFGYKMLG